MNRIQGNTASLIASGIYRMNRAREYAHDDLAAFHAPSECYRDANGSLDRDEVEFFRSWRRRTRMSQRQLIRFVRSRVSAKAAHYTIGI